MRPETITELADDSHTIERDAETGIVTYEAWYKDDKREPKAAPAVINHHPATGTATCEEWWDRDRLDRTGGPAVIVRNTTGEITREEWWKGGNRSAPGETLPAGSRQRMTKRRPGKQRKTTPT